jgi:hypothetical protein
MIKSTLYFGRGITWEDGTKDEVTYMNWVGFLKEVVDKHYEGYSWFEAYGVWKGEHEGTYVLVIIHEKAVEEVQSITNIIEAYKELYNQEAVLYETAEVRTALI